MNKEYYIKLIILKLKQQITPEQLEQLNKWLDQSQENRDIYKQYERIWHLFDHQDKNVLNIDVEDEWQKFKQKTAHAKVVDFRVRKLGVKLAAAAVILLMVALWIIVPKPKVYNVTTVTKITLSDSTQVILKPGAKLVVSLGYNLWNRNVKLQGTAFFSVTHNPSKPFVVHTHQFDVQVKGTKFLVSTNLNNVLVSSGKVLVHTTSDNVILKAGEQARINGRKIEKGKADKNLLAWQTGYLVFNNSTLEYVSRILTQVYNVQVKIDPVLADRRITATFKNQKFDDVIQVIAQTLGIRVIKQNNVYILTD